jgi:hypothetical protein
MLLYPRDMEDHQERKNGNNEKKIVELAFPKIAEESKFTPKGKGQDFLQHFSTSINEVTDWFKQYQVDTIELWISGVIETGGVTRLVVSVKGEGGLRVVLKPRSDH